MRYEIRAPLRLTRVPLRYYHCNPLRYQTPLIYEKDVGPRYESTLWQRGKGQGGEGGKGKNGQTIREIYMLL